MAKIKIGQKLGLGGHNWTRGRSQGASEQKTFFSSFYNISNELWARNLTGNFPNFQTN